MSNMKLWKSVCVTDPQAVKPITGKQYKGNSPKPYWLIQLATETFGPCGIGWGVEVVSERFERFGDEALHVALVRVWYKLEDARGVIEQMGQTKAAYTSAAGKHIVDEDAPKKSVTDGMVKCLSMIGFAGDIFSGQWDDSKYVAWADAQYAEKEAPKVIKTPALPKIELDPQTQTYLRETAMEAIAAVKAGTPRVAFELIEHENLDDDQKIALWGMLDSTTRSAIKTAKTLPL